MQAGAREQDGSRNRHQSGPLSGGTLVSRTRFGSRIRRGRPRPSWRA
ncbi:hypothetical protein KR76_00148 [Pimelobacter simplex]|uniref:Uncharacterized protein n=1 Tax=Nocardioides simplex TaxID=2045 RepID=A0A0C5XHV6_NOCSI|nr:hypothetical protein KR76_00148 [Pimelobacter simplex]